MCSAVSELCVVGFAVWVELTVVSAGSAPDELEEILGLCVAAAGSVAQPSSPDAGEIGTAVAPGSCVLTGALLSSVAVTGDGATIFGSVAFAIVVASSEVTGHLY
ncbi:ABC transporter ATP-binding protein [Babesia caballi]|uniref:ABC transporter ATP-binding protein n=1 Tax=Babesia caballi TaxID=5871 RepID=A0AAV4M133_BABCB|nr:ABC transporter ATP-binding protein [Babesia caballi]